MSARQRSVLEDEADLFRATRRGCASPIRTLPDVGVSSP
jgi:hypothetical protein